ncbi:MAG: ABC transporter substrate-binding protein [Flavobacteriaceae bacterium]|nr:ABC transporter substrate-binding protein [Flavobacteriaceae bacterium]
MGCTELKIKSELPKEETHVVKLKYAKGFSIEYLDATKVIHIEKPWPKSETSYSYVLSDSLIKTPIKKIVVTSTTHIPALELLGVEHTLVGFPGCDYISSEKTRQRIDKGEVRELGKNEGINTEVLLELNPDLVVGFGVDGVNKTFETIKKTGIPVIYNGDWVEDSPLAKAEWIKFFGVLFNKEKEADSIFNVIESNYISAKKMASVAINRPTILSGALHKDVWYLPNGSSPEARFLKDANVDYLWSETSGSGSLALSFESVFEKAKNADIWLSPSYYKSFDQLLEASEHYSKFEAFKAKKVYSFSLTTGKTGGVLYYELGTARPDLVLQDIIKICHPNLLKNYTPFFFKALE